MTAELEAVGLGYRYRPASPWAIEEVSLTLRSGDFAAIVGPNGSGKSTLMRLLYGALQPDSGEVRLDGKSLRHWRPRDRAQRIAVVGQEPFWNFPITVHDFVLQGRYPYLGRFGFESSRDIDCVDAALRRLDLAALSSRLVQEISAGERQRMLLARALAQEPEIFMLDEPTANLDLRYQVELLRLMLDLQRERDFAVLLISHELSLVCEFARRLLLLKRGRVIADGPPAEVIHPGNLETLFEIPFRVEREEGGRRYWIHPEAR